MEEKLLEIKYSMTLDEISQGFMLFWKKYQLKRTVIFTIVYAVAFVLGVDIMIRNASNFYGYVIAGLAAGMIFYSWYKPFQIRRKMLESISALAEETYITEIYPSELRVTTCIIEDEPISDSVEENAENVENEDNTEKSDIVEENAENVENEDNIGNSDNAESTDIVVSNGENSGNEERQEVSVYRFGTDLIDAQETEEMFLVYVNKRLIYIYPKRCLSDDEQTKLREILKDKAIL